jgi:MFS family permease
MRSFGWTPVHAGLIYGVIVSVIGGAGTLVGGWFADWLTMRGYEDAPYRAIFLSTAPLAPCAILAFVIATSAEQSAMAYGLWQFFAAVPSGLAAAAMMALAPNEMRAKTTAVYYLCINLFGVTLGPTCVGFLTTHIFRDESMLRYSLAMVSVFGTPLALLLIGMGMKHYRASLRDLQLNIGE